MVSVLATYIWNRGLINNSYNPALAWELGPEVIVTYTSDPVSIANFSEAQVTILGNVAHSFGHPFGFRPLIFLEFIFNLNFFLSFVLQLLYALLVEGGHNSLRSSTLPWKFSP